MIRVRQPVVVLAVLACLTGETHAQTPPRIAVVRLEAGPTPSGLATLLEAAGADGVTVRALGDDEVAALAGTVPPAFTQRLAVATELSRQGAELHAGLEHQVALERIAQARQILTAEVPSAEARQVLRDLWLLEGSALLATGRTDDAVRAFRACHRLDPQWVPDPAVVPPQVIVTWESAARRAASALGSLAVRSDPAGAEVFVDGVSAGTTPTVVESVEVGRVDLALELRGHRRIAVQVDVGAGSVEDVAFTFEPLPALERLREARLAIEGSPTDAAALGRIREALGVDLLVAVRAGRVFLVGADAASVTELSLDAAPAAVGRWLAPARPHPAIVPRRDRPRRRVAAPSTPLYGRWWFWTAAGTAVAGGVALTLALTASPGRELELTITER